MTYKGLEVAKYVDVKHKNYICINTVPVDKYPHGNHRIVSLYWDGERIIKVNRGYTHVEWYEI